MFFFILTTTYPKEYKKEEILKKTISNDRVNNYFLYKKINDIEDKIKNYEIILESLFRILKRHKLV